MGSLAQLRFGGGGALQTKRHRMCGEHLAVDGPHGGCNSPGTSQAQAAQAPGCTARAQSQVGCAFPQGSWAQAVTLPADVNHPGSQEDAVIGWQPAQCLVGSSLPGAETAVVLCLSPLAAPPLSLPPGRATNSSSPSIFGYLRGCDLLSCECTRGHGAALEPSRGKGPLFFFVSRPSRGLGFRHSVCAASHWSPH